MKRGFDWRYVAGTALLVALAAVILGVFSLLGRASEEDISLTDSLNERHGWSYELLADGRVQTYEPTFEDGRYKPVLPENVQAVRIRRTMTEDIANAELEWVSSFNGIEVSLNGSSSIPAFHRSNGKRTVFCAWVGRNGIGSIRSRATARGGCA